jgi:hypothetical protein
MKHWRNDDWQGNPEVLRENPVPVAVRPPQIEHETESGLHDEKSTGDPALFLDSQRGKDSGT